MNTARPMFTMSLEILGQLPRPTTRPARRYDEELDSLVSLLHDACVALQRTGQVRFQVGGFGQCPWPTDVRTDLAIVIEQLPRLAASLGSAEPEPCYLAFFEQGVERYLTFWRQGSVVEILCESLIDWQPDPPTERITEADLRQMVHDLATRFDSCVAAIRPSIHAHPWFQAWRTEVGLGGSQ